MSYFIHHRSRWGERLADITCVENNPRYVEVGRKLLPEARWINADVFDWRELDLGRFDCAIGNPPFGRVRRSGNAPRYRGPEFEFHVIDIAAELADHGAFIIPQQSASFQYSGRPYFERRKSGRGVYFSEATGFEMHAGVEIDTSIFRDQWKDTSIICEVACFDFAETREQQAAERERIAAQPLPIPSAQPAEQLALL
ncbi:methyltransferase [Sinorhizobium meliloti]|uniref:methyltransferase n=1 Tax=Rhizobium meliloti TaxID=382 RepID=UPI0030B63162